MADPSWTQPLSAVAYSRLGAAKLLVLEGGKMKPDYGPVKPSQIAKYQEEILYWSGGDKVVTFLLTGWLGGVSSKGSGGWNTTSDIEKAAKKEFGSTVTVKQAWDKLYAKNPWFAELISTKAYAREKMGEASKEKQLAEDTQKSVAKLAETGKKVVDAGSNVIEAAGNAAQGAGGLLLWLSQNPVMALIIIGGVAYGLKKAKIL